MRFISVLSPIEELIWMTKVAPQEEPRGRAKGRELWWSSTSETKTRGEAGHMESERVLQPTNLSNSPSLLLISKSGRKA
ncbi:hypothetical protein PAXRUDRAFT_833696 [Paxillus rubicundulus Ve08.2h10]|uniref:Uncharacterized protein n=1 Tax=Paxillus rubicundulus Ve08.2h10 TaxID=930991 RepID=A0A0D0DG36_9AGAM|nr:hypothetical protein PAXRUDRAFT_833696 [Paxillus rubicundulus Ve08.2h10]